MSLNGSGIIKDLIGDEIHGNAKRLVLELQGSLPAGLRCALFVFTADRGPVGFAHTADREKMISILEQTIKMLKERNVGGIGG